MQISKYPFNIQIIGDPSANDKAQLKLDIAEPVDDEPFDQVRCVVYWFAYLADQGGLGGKHIAPSHVSARLENQGEPDARSATPTWTFEKLCIDPNALIILFNLLQQTGLRINHATIFAKGSDIQLDISPDDYPECYPSIPFHVEDIRVNRNVEISAEFDIPVPDAKHELVSEPLKVWSLVGALGGFRLPLPFNEMSEMFPEDDPEIVLDELRFFVRTKNIADVAYDVLIHMFVKMSGAIGRINRVEIS